MKPETTAMSYAVKLLAPRPLSVEALRKKLLLQEFSTLEIEGALGVLNATGVLSDRLALESMIETLQRKNWGAERIREKALAMDFPENLVAELVGSESEFERAWTFASGSREPLPKLARQLANKGYGQEIVIEVIEKLEAERDL